MTIRERLREERLHLEVSQTALGAAGDKGRARQINYQKSVGSPDAGLLAAAVKNSVDALHAVTRRRKPAT